MARAAKKPTKAKAAAGRVVKAVKRSKPAPKRPAAKPTKKATAKRPAPKPAPKRTAKAATPKKAAPKPAPKAVAKPAPKPAAKPAQKPVAKASAKPATAPAKVVPAKAEAPPPPPPKPAPRPKEPPKKPAKPELTPREIQTIKASLEKQRDEFSREAEELEEGVFNMSQSEMSGEVSFDEEYADAGSATFEREKEMSIGNNVRDLLEKVNHALAAIDRGTYGLCENCGKPIAKARLLALPYSTLCLDCKQQEERTR